MGLNFFNDKFSIKSMFLKVKGSNFKQFSSHGFFCDVYNVHRIPYDYRFIDIMGLNFFNDKLSINSLTIFGQKIVFFVRILGLLVRKDDFDAIFFLSAPPPLAESGSRPLAESGSCRLAELGSRPLPESGSRLLGESGSWRVVF